MSAKKRPSSIPPRVFWLASALFFISGGTGLAYQVVWFKRFAHVWGSSSLAFAAVGASFLFGLGLGAWLLGRIADRVQSPLRWYGVCELAIGCLALVIPLEIAALVEASVGLYARIPEQPLPRFFIQFVITLLVIGPSCVMMGGTLPLLVRQLTARDGTLDQATGWLYAINTFGAAAGCYLTGFHFLPSFGLLWTNNAAAVVNILIGLVALWLSTSAVRFTRDRSTGGAESDAAGKFSFSLAAVYVASALAGAGALVLEMTWTRQLALVLGGSTYAFTGTLFVVLVGIAAGSLIFHAFLRPVAASPVLPAILVGGLVLSTLVGKSLLPWLSEYVGQQSVRDMRGEQLGNGAVCVGAATLLELAPAVVMGILFPLFVMLTRAGAARAGHAVGTVYAWNTLGSIIGASLTAILLFPSIGTAGATALGVGCYLVVLLAITPWRQPVGIGAGAAVLAGGAGALLLIARPADPRITNLGMYMYGSPDALLHGKTPSEWLASIDTLYFREGASSNVLVTRHAPDTIGLRVNGKVDATSGLDMGTQLGLAYFPRFFKPDAREVMVIGYGSGCTPGKSLLFPDTHVTCCEIEPLVYEATTYFDAFNDRPQEHGAAWLERHNASLPESERLTPEQIKERTRFSLILGDGRTAIQGSDKKFDLIISEPSNPWLAGVSNLFTQEFFRAAREHLTEDGVLAQWIQTYDFTINDYLMIVRTLRSEFKHCGVVMLVGGADTVLLASNKPLMPSRENLDRLQQIVDGSPRLSFDFKTWFGGTDVRMVLMQYYLLNEETLAKMVEHDSSRELNTDLHLRLEFDAPLHLFRKSEAREQANPAIVAASNSNPAWMRQLSEQLDRPMDKVEFHNLMGDYMLNQVSTPVMAKALREAGHLKKAANRFQTALKIDPNNAEAQKGLARAKLLNDTQSDLLTTGQELVRLCPDDAAAHGQLANVLLTRRQFSEAAEQYREALRLEPNLSSERGSLTWANNLAMILACHPDDKLRNGPEAVEWARRACEVDKGNNPAVQSTLAAALAETGKFDEAIAICEKLLAEACDQPQKAARLEGYLKLYRSSTPYRQQ